MKIDLLIHSAAQLLTCAAAGGPKRGADLRDVGLIVDGAVAIHDGRIVAVGTSAALRAQYQATEEVDASGKVIAPGFVDPHTHVVYAGDRINEFEQRISGVSYQEIAAAGGGILATMRATRDATVGELVQQTRPRLDMMLSLGTTTAEVKTGYALNYDGELRQLAAIAELDATHALDLVPTFLPAHAVPPELRATPDEYVRQIVEQMLPAAAEWYRASDFARRQVPLFVDVFCEKNAFDVAQSQRVLTAAQALGLPLKAHVDEFTELGGLKLALELGAVSVDHLDATGPAGVAALAASDCVGVIIPTVPFNLGSHHFAAARAMIEAGAAIALTTDINPGSSPCPSMPLAMAIACRYQRLTPAEAFNAATINAAYAVGLADRCGSLEVGKDADIIMIDSADYRQPAYLFGGNLVSRVWKRGRQVAGAA
jgi:imidazolonepropionase